MEQKKEILRYYENEIKERLKKYDVLALTEKMRVSDEFRSRLGDVQRAIQKDNSECSSIEEARRIFQQLYVDPNLHSIQLFQVMSGIQISTPFFIGGKIPGEIRGLYAAFWKNASLFTYKGNAWYIYRKDVLRAIAYHDWIQSMHLSGEDIEIVRPADITPDRYKNIPVWPTVRIERDRYGEKEARIFLSIGGDILGRKFWEQVYLRNLFIRQNEEYDEAGNMEGAGSLETKTKGVPYKNLRRAVQEIGKKKLTAADVWFFKNTIDPELIIGMCEIIGERNVVAEDYQLIWLLCKCRPASIRLYLLEAIKPAYGYIATYLKGGVNRKQREIIFTSLFDLLNEIIEKINGIFTETALEVRAILGSQKVSAAEFYESEVDLKRSFQSGDDFPFIERSEVELSQNENRIVNRNGEVEYISTSENGENNRVSSRRDGEEAKSYADYLPEKIRTNAGTPDRISYAVITALNKQWGNRDVEQGAGTQLDLRAAEDDWSYENEMESLRRFSDRLQWYLRRKV